MTSTIMGCGAFKRSPFPSMVGHARCSLCHWAVSGEWKKEMAADGSVSNNEIHPGADLLLALGVRIDRVTGKVEKFCEKGTIVHVDIDESEHNKNRKVQLPIVSDVKYALQRLLEMVRSRPIKNKFDPWHRRIADWKKRGAFRYSVTEEVAKSQHMREHLEGMEDEVILPQMAIETLHELTGGDAIITTGVGQHQMWAGQFFAYQEPRRYLTSAGLGAMGFGYPAALGAKVACPDKQVIDIDGDGSFW